MPELLERHRDEPAVPCRMLRSLGADMARGGFCAALAGDVRQFNGKLFKGSAVDGAAVRISMTVGAAGLLEGDVFNVWRETSLADGSNEVSFTRNVYWIDRRDSVRMSRT